jgi:ABC-2 type transport system ATP-binding protein
MSFFTDITLSGRRRTLLAVAALTALASPLALAQNKGEIRIAHVYSKTGPLEAYGAGKTTCRHRLRHRRARRGSVKVAGLDIVADHRAVRAMIGLVPQELTTDAFETVWATVAAQPGSASLPIPRHREDPEGAVAGTEGQPDHDFVGRHEAPGHDRRALSHEPRVLFLRADGRRRRRAAQDMWQISLLRSRA